MMTEPALLPNRQVWVLLIDVPETFAQTLATAKANNVNGAAIDGHTAEEITNIINGGKTFLTPDGTAGGAVGRPSCRGVN